MLARQGDVSRAEFEALAMPLFDSLYNLSRWMTRNGEDAEDLVQETYVKSLSAFKSFSPGTNFRAWMFRILRNTFLSSRTTAAARMTVSLDLPEEGPEQAVLSETPESILIACADVQMVRSAIEELPAHFREIILLGDMEEMSYRDLAETLSIPMGTVMSRLARARRALRKQLTKPTGDPLSSAPLME
jgi:RNA polymerase sigma-70 factor, ECF subfamily